MVRKTTPHKRNRTLALTARSIGTIPPERSAVDWFDQATPGLSLQVTPGGARTWYLFYRAANTARRVKLGTWPALGLKDARDLARSTRVRIETTGADPAHERAAARTVFTFADLAALYMSHHAKPRKIAWQSDQYKIDRFLGPAWGSRAVTSITRTEIHALLDKIAIKTPVHANRTQSLISKLFNFAIDREHATVNPCHRMPKRGKETARVTVLDDDALRALWIALDALPGAGSDAVRLRLLTGQRGGEVFAMRWADLEQSATGVVWNMPTTKNGRPHRVPLSKAAAAVVTARWHAGPEDPDRVFRFLNNKARGIRNMAAIPQGAYRWHDLRRTFASRLAGLGVAEEVISRLLNHAKRGITASVYNQYAYDGEKLAALERWAAELSRIVTGQPAGGAVLAFRREGAR